MWDNANNIYLLHFSEAVEANGSIEYFSLDTQKLKAFPLMAGAVQQELARKDVFNAFCALLPAGIKREPVQLVLLQEGNKTRPAGLGVFYFEDQTILPVRFLPSQKLDTWHAELFCNTTRNACFIISSNNCKKYIYGNAVSQSRPFIGIGSLIYKLAPAAYKNACDAGLKATFMAQFKGLNVPHATVDSTKLKEQWSRLLLQAQLKGNAALEHEEVYSVFQQETGLGFPKELKVMLRVCNGINEFLNGTEFLSGEKILEEWKNWKAIYQASDYKNIIDEYQYKHRSEKTVPMYVNPFRIPFIHDGGGNFIGIDMLPNRAGKIGQIIAFGVDESAIRYVASDMLDFIQQFLNGRNPMNNDKPAEQAAVG